MPSFTAAVIAAPDCCSKTLQTGHIGSSKMSISGAFSGPTIIVELAASADWSASPLSLLLHQMPPMTRAATTSSATPPST